MKHRELGAEDPLISYDKKEKNPQSESRRSGLIYYNCRSRSTASEASSKEWKNELRHADIKRGKVVVAVWFIIHHLLLFTRLLRIRLYGMQHCMMHVKRS